MPNGVRISQARSARESWRHEAKNYRSRSDSLLVGMWAVCFPRSGINAARGEITPKVGKRKEWGMRKKSECVYPAVKREYTLNWRGAFSAKRNKRSGMAIFRESPKDEVLGNCLEMASKRG